MATWDDVRRLALALPETTERERDRSRRVKDKGFAWERPRGAPRARLTGGALPGSAAWLTSDG